MDALGLTLSYDAFHPVSAGSGRMQLCAAPGAASTADRPALANPRRPTPGSRASSAARCLTPSARRSWAWSSPAPSRVRRRRCAALVLPLLAAAAVASPLATRSEAARLPLHSTSLTPCSSRPPDRDLRLHWPLHRPRAERQVLCHHQARRRAELAVSSCGCSTAGLRCMRMRRSRLMRPHLPSSPPPRPPSSPPPQPCSARDFTLESEQGGGGGDGGDGGAPAAAIPLEGKGALQAPSQADALSRKAQQAPGSPAAGGGICASRVAPSPSSSADAATDGAPSVSCCSCADVCVCFGR